MSDTLPERIEAAIREWPQWSRAERARMSDIVAEVMGHVRNGGGNRFVREFVSRVLVPQFRGDGMIER